ncbi:DNA-binding transcriptional LysR family regulator [Filimonas zeae]|uniref:Transcriptional regulator n=1 Tax=Filimonas zeae TaxID=1737353 RepID=A0A917IYW6_9BACT|nr:LysR family transcriptional regulator [Filimonas zeae]MDR6338340.1 DNA-binding transcriptional LysR family regulator [Filimonas zeae]GGH68720.1 transcriptional regulator [Filimonas zeae]
MLSTHHQVFIEVAKEKSFSKASDTLFISQPAISKHIKSLEEYYNTRLFDRKGIHIELTPAGKLLLQRLLQVKTIQEETEFDLSIMSHQSMGKGVLKLGASTTIALYILPKVLSVFLEHYPQMEVNLLNRNSEIVLQALLNQEINLGIIEGREKLTNVVYHPFMNDRVIAVCSKKNAIARKKSYPLKEVINMSIALRERGSGTLEALKYALEKNKIGLNDLQVKARLGGTEALKNFLIESDCVGFLPQRSVIKELKYGELTEVHFEGLHIERSFYFIQRKGETSELNKKFIAQARKVYNK